MKALSLYQPYASAIEREFKRYETRPFRTHYRGPLLICSTATTPAKVLREAMAKIDEHVQVTLGYQEDGAALCVVDLVSCEPAERVVEAILNDETPPVRPRDELLLGDFTPGRFAWRLENVRRLSRPIPVKGRQRLWTPSPELLAQVEEELR
jgi:hypothetical protein